MTWGLPPTPLPLKIYNKIQSPRPNTSLTPNETSGQLGFRSICRGRGRTGRRDVGGTQLADPGAGGPGPRDAKMRGPRDGVHPWALKNGGEVPKRKTQVMEIHFFVEGSEEKNRQPGSPSAKHDWSNRRVSMAKYFSTSQ